MTILPPFTFYPNADIIFLDVLESPRRVKLAASIGQKVPAFATAAGKSILAQLPEEIVRRVLDQGMHLFTPNTIISPVEFVKTLELIRARGYAISKQEFEDGINSVAAPVLDTEKKPIAAITVAGPAYRLTEEKMYNIGISVMEAVKEVAQRLSETSAINHEK